MRYARQTALPGIGEAGQARLRKAHVALIGVGGVGSAALPLLVGAGVGRLTLVDGDTVAVHNLHRQTLYSEEHVGLSKVQQAVERARRLNAEVQCHAIDRRLEGPDDALAAIAGADLVLDATDSFEARFLVSSASKKAGVPQIMSSAGGFVSQLLLFGNGFYLPDLLQGDTAGPSEKPKGAPIFGPAAHLSGVWGAAYALRFLGGAQARFESGLVQSFDLSTNRFTQTFF